MKEGILLHNVKSVLDWAKRMDVPLNDTIKIRKNKIVCMV